MPWTYRPVWFALVAVLAAAAWQALTVRYNYGGNWTALFCTGSQYAPPPAALASEHIYVFPNTLGYDGQSYHYIAHDPFFKRGFKRSLDDARYRYRRILVPLSAWLVAGGQDRFVDRAYVAVIWFWVFAGTLWTGLVARERGANSAWSLVFLVVPAVSVSLDRLTVDVALVALTAGVVYYADRRNWLAAGVLCALAGLTRESGLLIPAALAVWCAVDRRWLRAAGMAMSMAPALAWYRFVDLNTAPSEIKDLASVIPFAGILRRLGHPISYPFGFAVNALATVLDYAALAGILAAVVYCGVHWRRLLRQPDGAIAFAFVALVAVVSSPGVWEHTYGFARGYSPLVLVVGLDGFRSRSAVAGLPVAMTAPRIGLEMGPQLLRVVRGLLGA
jgi:hypothetical protein